MNRLAPFVAVTCIVGSLAGCGGVRPATRPAAPSGPSPQALAELWDAEHVSPPLSPLVDHAEVVRRLGVLEQEAPDLFAVEEIGQSIEGRSINHVTFGHGPFVVLLWSQMHGDEPSATSALFDLFEYLRRHRGDPMARRVLDALTIHVVPMLNPDGAEAFTRRNAQGIDINRDARRLQTPEGRILEGAARPAEPEDRVQPAQPELADLGRPAAAAASISLLSVAFDEARTVSEGRLLTKKTCAVIRDALEPLAPGRIGRYDDEFEVRAFGDNVTRWGTPVVLIETGPWSVENPDPALVRLNFVAILTALDALATGRVHEADPQRYETLPTNESRLFYQLVTNATVLNGAGVAPFTADLGINATRRVADPQTVDLSLRIDDMGDLGTDGALETIDATGLVAAPLFGEGVLQEGQEVAPPAWTDEHRSQHLLKVGEPAGLVLLRPTGVEGRYRVVRVIQPTVGWRN